MTYRELFGNGNVVQAIFDTRAALDLLGHDLHGRPDRECWCATTTTTWSSPSPIARQSCTMPATPNSPFVVRVSGLHTLTAAAMYWASCGRWPRSPSSCGYGSNRQRRLRAALPGSGCSEQVDARRLPQVGIESAQARSG